MFKNKLDFHRHSSDIIFRRELAKFLENKESQIEGSVAYFNSDSTDSTDSTHFIHHGFDLFIEKNQ